jgi:hypothetical protein
MRRLVRGQRWNIKDPGDGVILKSLRIRLCSPVVFVDCRGASVSDAHVNTIELHREPSEGANKNLLIWI